MLEGGYPQRFTSQLTIPERPFSPLTSDIFSTKKDARSAAAKAAVLWLRSQGITIAAVEKRPRNESSAESVTEDAAGPKSLPEQVHQLAATLGLKVQPRWVLKPSTLPSGQPIVSGSPFYDCHAEFDKRDMIVEERLRGAIGEAKHCLGRKKAKEACCELVIPVLEGIKRKRLGLE